MSVDISYIMDVGAAARGDFLRTKARVLSLAALAAVLLTSLAFAATKLPERYRAWLDEEVTYIIAPTERDVFQKLQTDRERDLFIEAFWKHRDPTPASGERVQDRTLPPDQLCQPFSGPGSAQGGLADRPRPDLYHPGRAERHQPHAG